MPTLSLKRKRSTPPLSPTTNPNKPISVGKATATPKTKPVAEEEDLAVLIYKSSKTAQARAAAADKIKMKETLPASGPSPPDGDTTSTPKTSEKLCRVKIVNFLEDTFFGVHNTVY